MKNLFKTSLTLALAGVIVFGAVAPVFATVDETQSATGEFVDGEMILTGVDGAVVTENSKMETEVVYTQESTFTVEIPKVITLDKTTKDSDYTVNVQGDISSDKQVKVAPDASFLMKDQSGAAVLKDDVTATVTQAETIWSSDEVCITQTEAGDANGDSVVDDGETITTLVGKDKTGNVSAQDLTAGSWKGTFNFAIALENVQ